MNTKVTSTLKALTVSIMFAGGLLTTNLSNAAEVINLNLDYPSDGEIVKKTDGLKVQR